MAEPNTLGKADWTFLFRLTINQPENLDNLTKVGDRTLCVWLHKSLTFIWVGYDYEFP